MQNSACTREHDSEGKLTKKNVRTAQEKVRFDQICCFWKLCIPWIPRKICVSWIQKVSSDLALLSQSLQQFSTVCLCPCHTTSLSAPSFVLVPVRLITSLFVLVSDASSLDLEVSLLACLRICCHCHPRTRLSH